MKSTIDGVALVYAEGAFNTLIGKTANGLVRFTLRYDIAGIIDSAYAGEDAGMVLDHQPNGIPVFRDLTEALNHLGDKRQPEILVMGIAPDGGRLPLHAKGLIKQALQMGMNIDSGLHDYISSDEELMQIAREKSCRVRDLRKTPDVKNLHFFSGKINKVNCLKVAVLGGDSAIGKRTTAWMMVRAFREAGYRAELIGTGQTAWLQGARYTMIIDSCINDFVSGEIEHAVYEAWNNESPDVLVIEGQGSLMNPAYPGGFEILAAARPDVVVFQHAPKRLEYDGFPGYRLHSLEEQIHAIETISPIKVVAVTINHEGMTDEEIPIACQSIYKQTGLPAFDVLKDGAYELIESLKKHVK
jgi:uncharacterized NAD-dependent epimerase/dehydratase family protein